jgi:hypothetical protein
VSKNAKIHALRKKPESKSYRILKENFSGAEVKN